MLPHINYAPALRAYDSAEARAIERDQQDAEHLAALDALIGQWLDQLAPYAHNILHPDAKWQPGELVDALRGELINVRGEAERLRGPLVLNDE